MSGIGVDADDEAKVREQMYMTYAQTPEPFLRQASGAMELIVRTSVPPFNLLEKVRRRVRGRARDQVLYETHSMEQIVNATLGRQRFLLLLFGVFAGLALLLASVGIYGVLAYLTTQRVPEIGLRLALGATAENVMRLVFQQSCLLILAGVVLGTLGAYAASRLLQSLVSGVRASEPLTFAAMIAILCVAAFIATLLPARRASKVDPMRALRQE